MDWVPWQKMDQEDQWGRMEKQKILFPRRRPVRPSTDELGGREENNDIPTAPEELPECSDEASGRDISKIDTRKGQNWPRRK